MIQHISQLRDIAVEKVTQFMNKKVENSITLNTLRNLTFSMLFRITTALNMGQSVDKDQHKCFPPIFMLLQFFFLIAEKFAKTTQDMQWLYHTWLALSKSIPIMSISEALEIKIPSLLITIIKKCFRNRTAKCCFEMRVSTINQINIATQH